MFCPSTAAPDVDNLFMSELSYDMFRVVGVVTHTYIPIQESPLEQSMVDYCDLLCAQMID